MWVLNLIRLLRWIDSTSLSFLPCLSSSDIFSFIKQKVTIYGICVVFLPNSYLHARHKLISKLFLDALFTNNLSSATTMYRMHFKLEILNSCSFCRQFTKNNDISMPVPSFGTVPKSFSSKKGKSLAQMHTILQINFNYCSGVPYILLTGDDIDLWEM